MYQFFSDVLTRWAPTSYKWSYNPYKWPYKWVNGVITLLIGVITPLITSRGPPCRDLVKVDLTEFSSRHFQRIVGAAYHWCCLMVLGCPVGS